MLTELTKAVLGTALVAGMGDYLGYEKRDHSGEKLTLNEWNGTRSTTVVTKIGPVEINVPRDRDGLFAPVIVPERVRRLGGVDQMVLSLSARGFVG